MLKSQACPNCSGAGLELQPDGRAVCQYCGTTYTAPGPICLACEEINPAEAEFCQQCGRALYRFCPVCQVRNWDGAEACIKCGRPLDMMAQLAERWKQDTSDRLDEQMRQAAAIKAIEQADAQRRTAMFEALEAHRQEELRAARVKRAQRERQIIGCTVISVIFFLLIMAAALSSILIH